MICWSFDTGLILFLVDLFVMDTLLALKLIPVIYFRLALNNTDDIGLGRSCVLIVKIIAMKNGENLNWNFQFVSFKNKFDDLS